MPNTNDVHTLIHNLEDRLTTLEGITDALDDLMEDAKPGKSYLMGQLLRETRALRKDWNELFEVSVQRNALFANKDLAA